MTNQLLGTVIRWGWMPQQFYLLTVRGRKSGKEYTAPVELVIQDGVRYAVSPYGEVSWVKNVRVVGQATLTRAGKQEMVKLQEVDAKESAKTPCFSGCIIDSATLKFLAVCRTRLVTFQEL